MFAGKPILADVSCPPLPPPAPIPPPPPKFNNVGKPPTGPVKDNLKKLGGKPNIDLDDFLNSIKGGFRLRSTADLTVDKSGLILDDETLEFIKSVKNESSSGSENGIAKTLYTIKEPEAAPALPLCPPPPPPPMTMIKKVVKVERKPITNPKLLNLGKGCVNANLDRDEFLNSIKGGRKLNKVEVVEKANLHFDEDELKHLAKIRDESKISNSSLSLSTHCSSEDMMNDEQNRQSNLSFPSSIATSTSSLINLDNYSSTSSLPLESSAASYEPSPRKPFKYKVRDVREETPPSNIDAGWKDEELKFTKEKIESEIPKGSARARIAMLAKLTSSTESLASNHSSSIGSTKGKASSIKSKFEQADKNANKEISKLNVETMSKSVVKSNADSNKFNVIKSEPKRQTIEESLSEEEECEKMMSYNSVVEEKPIPKPLDKGFLSVFNNESKGLSSSQSSTRLNPSPLDKTTLNAKFGGNKTSLDASTNKLMPGSNSCRSSPKPLDKTAINELFVTENANNHGKRSVSANANLNKPTAPINSVFLNKETDKDSKSIITSKIAKSPIENNIAEKTAKFSNASPSEVEKTKIVPKFSVKSIDPIIPKPKVEINGKPEPLIKKEADLRKEIAKIEPKKEIAKIEPKKEIAVIEPKNHSAKTEPKITKKIEPTISASTTKTESKAKVPIKMATPLTDSKANVSKQLESNNSCPSKPLIIDIKPIKPASESFSTNVGFKDTKSKTASTLPVKNTQHSTLSPLSVDTSAVSPSMSQYKTAPSSANTFCSTSSTPTSSSPSMSPESARSSSSNDTKSFKSIRDSVSPPSSNFTRYTPKPLNTTGTNAVRFEQLRKSFNTRVDATPVVPKATKNTNGTPDSGEHIWKQAVANKTNQQKKGEKNVSFCLLNSANNGEIFKDIVLPVKFPLTVLESYPPIQFASTPCETIKLKSCQASFNSFLGVNEALAADWTNPTLMEQIFVSLYKPDLDSGMMKLCAARSRLVQCLGTMYNSCMNRFYFVQNGLDIQSASTYVSLFKELEFQCAGGLLETTNDWDCIYKTWSNAAYKNIINYCLEELNDSIGKDPASFCIDGQSFVNCVGLPVQAFCKDSVAWWSCERARIAFQIDGYCPDISCAKEFNTDF
uniref:WH2 domain-containing protein n=1 Tax=Rhabditophanes sp. KR3021 TaxID=114890 RepID=A0AC35U5L0_9BILA